ncbi:MAG: DUF362 domain-containing protein [Pseudomonadota bacterium]
MEIISSTLCESYDLEVLQEKILHAIEFSGFDLSAVKGKRVLLKPNLLGAYPPSRAVTTHPRIVEAVINIFKQRGAIVSVGDSPGYAHKTEDVLKTTGIGDVCAKSDVPFIILQKQGAKHVEGLLIANDFFNFDYVINLPKLKTHSLTLLTCAVKNLFGCVPGMQKVVYHRQYQDKMKFSEMLVKISQIVKTDLTIVDAVEIMDGDGPSAGTKKHLGAVFVGKNIHAVDSFVAKLMGIEAKDVPSLVIADRMGIWKHSSEIEIRGELPDIKGKSFSIPKTFTTGLIDRWIVNAILSKIWSNLKLTPTINNDKCERCGICVKSCPVGAIIWKDVELFPVIDKKRCVECSCCHELCPVKAVELTQSLLMKIGRRLGRMNAKEES